MVNGELQCCGTSQHLKHKFGQGYQVEMQTKEHAEAVEKYGFGYLRVGIELKDS